MRTLSNFSASTAFKRGDIIGYIRSRYILKKQNCVHQKQVHIAIQNQVQQKQVHFENPEVCTFSKSRSRYILLKQKQVHHQIYKLIKQQIQKQVHFDNPELCTSEVGTFCKIRTRYILQNQKQVHFENQEVGTSTITMREGRRRRGGA